MSNAILWYEIKNIGSFEDEGGFVDLTTTAKDKKKELWVDVDGHKVNLITAIMGANASGKTTLLKPMSFLSWFFWSIPAKVTDYLYLNINRPFTKPGMIKICFVLDGKVYTYVVTACDHFVIKEELYVRNEKNKNIYVFKRKLDKENYEKQLNNCSDDFSHQEVEELLKTIKYDYVEKAELFPLGLLEGKRTPANTSIISAARRVGVPLAIDIAEKMSSTTNVNAMGRYSYDYGDLGATAEDLYKDPVAFKSVKNILRKWDLGLDDITIEKEEKVDINGEKDVYYIINGIHEKEDGSKFELPFAFESAGTQSAFIRLHNIMQCLKKGTACFIDELGDDLHPHMVKPILELFISKETNPLHAQLIFTCHKPELINYLGKYRVLITEKKFNRSECYRLDDFPSSEARVDDNIAAKYLAGAFGGVPDL
ncbi:AAA family ATPase [Escherichia sp. MOD1-EC4550]|uniref:AAA family ATPase n=1 Tax=Escherichia sp. MOD1-EC4550 TaxID=2093861 RepID=UPI000CF77E65|nr:ATP-binding protein [Escherichia sp. MOD1-EC4550]EKY6905580.1 AAA family ATPase [Escherichia coli]